MRNAAGALVALFLVLPAGSSAQTAETNDWNAVRQLAAGTRVSVTDSRGERTAGKVRTASDDSLQLSKRWGREQTFHRLDVREVRLDRAFGPGRGFALGLLVGAVAGNIAGHGACPSSGCRGEDGLAIAAGMVNGTLFGGMGGAAIGQAVKARPGRLIYQRRK